MRLWAGRRRRGRASRLQQLQRQRKVMANKRDATWREEMPGMPYRKSSMQLMRSINLSNKIDMGGSFLLSWLGSVGNLKLLYNKIGLMTIVMWDGDIQHWFFPGNLL